MTHAFPTRRASELIGALCFFQQTLARSVASVLMSRRIAISVSRSFSESSASRAAAGSARIGLRTSARADRAEDVSRPCLRSEEHTSEIQSLLRISYAVFCLKQ